MKKKATLVGIIALSVGFFSLNSMSSLKFSSSAPPASKTGAPGEGLCTDCHSGTATTGTHTFTFSGSNNEYVAGQTYTITLDIGGSNAKNGFQVVALRDSDNASVGAWTATGGDEATMSGMSRDYIGHSSSGTAQTSWSFEWTAPAQNEGNITFYVVVNESNSNFSTSGDLITTSNHSITPSTVGIEDEKFAEVSMFYVPFVNEIQLNGFTSEFNDVKLELVNLSGKVVERLKVKDISDSYSWKLQNHYSEGIYLISIRNKKDKIVKKIFLH